MFMMNHIHGPHVMADSMDQQTPHTQSCDLPLDFSQPVNKPISIQADSAFSQQSSIRLRRDRKRCVSVGLNPLRPGYTDPDGMTSRTGITSDTVYEVVVRGEPLVCLEIEGVQRLCLAQISSTLLKKFSYNEIHNRRVALGITCVQCSPAQLELLRDAGAMPASSRRCGTITRREAERLVKSFLDEPEHPKLPEGFAFDVTHHCGWGCQGQFVPSRYNSSRAKCVRCNVCQIYFSPNKFVFHSHSPQTAGLLQKAEYRHPDAANFNAWRRHLFLVHPNPSIDLIYAWEDVKAMFNGGNRKRTTNVSGLSNSQSSSDERPNSVCGSVSEEFTYSRKRHCLRIDDSIDKPDEAQKDRKNVSLHPSAHVHEQLLVNSASREKLAHKRSLSPDPSFTVNKMLTNSPNPCNSTIWNDPGFVTLRNTQINHRLLSTQHPWIPSVPDPNMWPTSSSTEATGLTGNSPDRTTRHTTNTTKPDRDSPGAVDSERTRSIHPHALILPPERLSGHPETMFEAHVHSMLPVSGSRLDVSPLRLPYHVPNMDARATNAFLYPWSMLFAQRFWHLTCGNLSDLCCLRLSDSTLNTTANFHATKSPI